MKKVLALYRTLKFWEKVGVWGSLASLIAIPLSVVLQLSSCNNARAPEDIYVKPYSLQVSDNYVEVCSKFKNVIWTQSVLGDVVKAEIADINFDGKSEVILGVGGKGKDSGKIMVFDCRGQLIWTCDTNARPNYNGGTSGKLKVVDFKVANLFSRKRMQVIAISIDAQGWYQTRLCIIDYDGKLLSSYWHPGYLGPIAVARKSHCDRSVIVVAGVNNDLGRYYSGKGYLSCVFMLDPNNVSGEAPPYFGRLPRGSQLWYGVVLPKGVGIQKLDIIDPDNEGQNRICVWTDNDNVLYLNWAGERIGAAAGDAVQGTAHFQIVTDGM